MEEILFNKKASILFIEERSRKEIVIGAPHHTVGGVTNMPCPEHTAGDENTGFIARQIAENLNCSSIIACNYKIDPNKSLQSDYATQIGQWKPKYLIEIHGHGGKKIKENIIEISSGSKEKEKYSIAFSKTLSKKFEQNESLKIFEVNGEFEKIYFKASKTATIIDDKWISFHIELPPKIRLNNNDSLPENFNDFTNYITETILEICK